MGQHCRTAPAVDQDRDDLVCQASGEPEWMRFARLLAGEIRTWRKAAGSSQSRLAARIGYTGAYVSMAERPGKGLASEALVRAIDNALGAGGRFVELRRRADPRGLLADAVSARAQWEVEGTPPVVGRSGA